MAIDAFLQFTETGGVAPDLAGETQDKYFSKPPSGPACFELKNWGFGASNTASISSMSGGAGSGKATFAEFNVVKMVDIATPSLFHTLCVGGHYKTLTLWIRKSGGDPKAAGAPYLEWKFAMAFVKDVTWSHDDAGPTETVNFVYGAMRFSYKQQATTGQIGVSGEKATEWSQVLNAKVFDVGAGTES
jgi:type VI secretion system secreted protein Hcp